jgi:glycosyltransferase involved in cell wall biosynthesis
MLSSWYSQSVPDFERENADVLASIPVTALLPIKNGLNYVARARHQLENTCRENDEILVIDDNSIDGTAAFLEKWASEDQRVRVLKNSGEGLVSALNLGVKESTNQWIARFDVDDTYNFERIHKQVSRIKHNVVAVFSDYKILRPNGQSLGIIPSPVYSDAVAVSLISSRRTAHPSVIFSRDAVMSVGGYLPSDFPAEDLSLWLRLSRVGQLVSTPEVLLNYELGLNSVSGQKRHLIQSMTSSLIRDVGIEAASLDSAYQRVDELMESYSHLNFGCERQILFIQELSKALKFSGKSTMFGPVKHLIKRINIDLVRAGMNISVETFKRRAYRKQG